MEIDELKYEAMIYAKKLKNLIDEDVNNLAMGINGEILDSYKTLITREINALEKIKNKMI